MTSRWGARSGHFPSACGRQSSSAEAMRDFERRQAERRKAKQAHAHSRMSTTTARDDVSLASHSGHTSGGKRRVAGSVVPSTPERGGVGGFARVARASAMEADANAPAASPPQTAKRYRSPHGTPSKSKERPEKPASPPPEEPAEVVEKEPAEEKKDQ